MFEVLELLSPLTAQFGSDPTHHQDSERGSGQQDGLVTAAKELQQAWGRNLHCQLQLQTRLEILRDWAISLQQDGGILGKEMPVGAWMSLICLLWVIFHNSSHVFSLCAHPCSNTVLVPSLLYYSARTSLIATENHFKSVNQIAFLFFLPFHICRKSDTVIKTALW